jgi:ATP-dependent RNA helicase HelY
VGINMPAKTVVIDKLTKFTGDHHTSLSPGEYTQLTGRAGRRGLDEQGYAVVPWSPFVPFEQVAALAASRSFQLRSAFRPTYNMAANLVRTYTSDRARHLLNMSFAQFQADRDVVKIEARLERRQQLHAELVAAAESSYGDIADYLRQLPSSNRSRGPVRDDVIELAVSRLEPGDVIELPGALGTEIGVVLTTAVRRNGLRIRVVTESHRTLTLTPEEFRRPPVATHSVVLPDGFAPNSPDYLRQVTSLLDSLPRHPTHLPHSGSMVYQHPVLADPDIDVRLRAAARADQVLREVHDLQRQVQRRNQSISNDFDRVLGVLQRYQYLDAWSLTDRGVTLAKTFHECDLLIVECLHRGLLDGLPPAELAGLASVFVYEHRSPEVPPTPWFPSAAVRRRWASILDVSDELTGVEEDAGLSVHREPDPTFVAVAYAWAAGEGFSEVIESEEITGGDFVRTIKQLIDLLRQIALVATDRATRRAASDASEQLFRGVVSASNAVEADTTRDTMRSESAIEGTVA